MSIQKLFIASFLVMLSFVTFNLYAQENPDNDDGAIIVTANRFAMQEFETPFASEIYTAEDIKKSGADNLYRFLDQYTSMTVLPAFGNPFVQKFDMRGYGIGDGFQNIVVTLDGQRLNNIDLVPQLLSTIPLLNIKRIEITKGSGSVTSGDGAMAGNIHIYTKDNKGITFSAVHGSYGLINAKLIAGITDEKYSLNASAENYRHSGYSEPDVTGKKDTATSNNYGLKGKYYPFNNLEIRLGQSQATINTIYPGSLTQAEFNENPAQNSGNTYTHQEFVTNNTNAGATYDINPATKIVYDVYHERKKSEYVTSSYISEYAYDSHDLAVKYNLSVLKIIAGIQAFDGKRTGTSNETRKLNEALFVQGLINSGSTIYSAGARTEKVSYIYQPKSGATLKDSHSLSAYDFGLNYHFNKTYSLFSNYQHAYQAPDIDRFFNFGGSFNAFIEPATSDTVNIGVNIKTTANSWKVGLFYIDLENEIYYNSSTFINTNIDQSHKYGIEYQSRHNFTSQLSGNLNYTYTRAIIDNENDGSGTFNGKNLPGVSEHSVNLGLNYSFEKSVIGLNQVYRNETYAANDFANNLGQKQPAYNSTNILYTYNFAKTSIFAGIDNLFDQANGIQVRDDAIYPVNFTRTWKIGLTMNL